MEELLLSLGLMGLMVCCIVYCNKRGQDPTHRSAPGSNPYSARTSSRSNLPNPDLLAITIAIKRGFQRGLGGIILINTATKKALAVEFFGPTGNGVEVEFVQSPNVDRAKAFL